MAPWQRQGPIPLSYQFYRMSHCNESLQWSYTGTGISDSKTSPYGKVELNMDEANRFSRGYSKNLIFMSYTVFFFLSYPIEQQGYSSLASSIRSFKKSLQRRVRDY